MNLGFIGHQTAELIRGSGFLDSDNAELFIAGRKTVMREIGSRLHVPQEILDMWFAEPEE
ncbi:MAG: hypothetical protein F4X58_04445 [Chloroflexi bacterium]|nr:hypothetical protein [Chloroflexota bacterium]MYC01151.1 hypothetical protein [Chloroflexota bacterium]